MAVPSACSAPLDPQKTSRQSLAEPRPHRPGLLFCVLSAALLTTATAAPAWARFATPFQTVASEAPLVVRARVVAKIPSQQPNDNEGMDVRLDVERMLVGPSVRPTVTLHMRHEQTYPRFKEGSVYLLTLQTPDALYYDRNHCGTQNSLEVVGDKVPGFRYLYPSRPSLEDYVFGPRPSLAEVETAIISERCHDGQICTDDYKPRRMERFLHKFSLNNLLMAMASFALLGYSLLLARRRTALAQDTLSEP